MKELNKNIENVDENIEAVFEELVNRDELVCTGDGCAGNACGVYEFP